MTVKVKIFDDDDKNRILKDGETMTVKMFMKDGSPNPALTPAQRVAAAVAATRDAMKSFDSSMHRMHKPGHRYAADAAGFTADSAAAAVVARDAAYSDYERRQADAWKTGRTRDAPPDGSYPASEADEGDACTIDGRPGRLCTIDGHEGYLECIADDDNDGGTDDSRRATHDTRTPQQIKADAYAAYDSEVSDAWRNK
jgi:hypothetical protein